MPKTIELSIPRAMSTPVRIELVAEHLPAPVRDGLDQLIAARAELAQAEQDLASAQGADWAEASERARTAREVAGQALTDFAGTSAASTTATRDAAAVAFTSAVEAAHGHLRAALDSLAEASQAAALHRSVKPGKPVLRLDTRAAGESKTRQRISEVRSELRDLLSQLPDAVDE